MRLLSRSLRFVRNLKGMETGLRTLMKWYSMVSNAIFNTLTLTLELLNYYYNVWASYDTSKLSPEEIEGKRRENAERVIEITKWAFVHAMSIIEFSIKNAVKIIDTSMLKSIEA